jgi:hypothetical protein
LPMHKKIGILLAGLMLLPGCMHVPAYKAKPLTTLRNDFMYHETKSNIVLRAKRLTYDDNHYFFNARGKYINNSFAVIYLSVHNLSSSFYQISPTDINDVIVSSEKVIKKLKTNSGTRLAGGIISVSEALLSLLFGAGDNFMGGPSLIILIGFPIGIGLGCVFLGDALKSRIMNTRIKKDLEEKIFDKDVIIPSGDKYEGLIFVKTTDYKPQFSVVLHDKTNAKNAVAFDVNLP